LPFVPSFPGAIDRLASLPRVPLVSAPSPVERLDRLRSAIGAAPVLVVKRDDALPFGFGGNKIRKLQLVAAEARAAGANTLITCGGVQSNHARATASVAARLGMRCILVANGARPDVPRANARLNMLLGAETRYVGSREARAPEMERAADEVRAAGGTPFVIPLGASTPLGAAAYAAAVGELLEQIDPPDAIVHSTSSGGTQAGLVAGCRLHGLTTRVIGISADDPAAAIEREVRRLLAGLGELLEVPTGEFDGLRVEVDDTHVGEGYGIPTPQSTAALSLAARMEALFLDPTYTAKAMAGLIASVRAGALGTGTVLFWHTGGQAGLFA